MVNVKVWTYIKYSRMQAQWSIWRDQVRTRWRRRQPHNHHHTQIRDQHRDQHRDHHCDHHDHDAASELLQGANLITVPSQPTSQPASQSTTQPTTQPTFFTKILGVRVEYCAWDKCPQSCSGCVCNCHFSAADQVRIRESEHAADIF